MSVCGNIQPNRIMAVAGDAGGAAAIVPVLQRMKGLGGSWLIQVMAYNQAREIFSKSNVPYNEIGERSDEAEVSRHFQKFRPDCLLTATSVNGVDWEKFMISESRHAGIPSLSVLDFWSNYRARFSNQRNQLAYLPDRIAVMDKCAQNEMIQQGFPEGCLVVTGQPVFDELFKSKTEYELEARNVRSKYTARFPCNKVVVFLSQPISRFYASPVLCDNNPGYNEADVFKILVDGLEQLTIKLNIKINLLVRAHPRETWSLASDGKLSWGIYLHRVEQEKIRPLLMAADMVVGMTTVLLMESCLLGCVTVSLQPGLQGPDILPANRMGLAFSVYERECAVPVLATALLDESARAEKIKRMAAIPAQGRGAERVIEEISRVISLNRRCGL